MARKCMPQRLARRVKLSNKHWTQRQALKKIIKDLNVTPEERWAAVLQLQKRARDESVTRVHTCCLNCQRPRGVYKRFRLCRICLRQLCMDGHVPGLAKSSW